jgi:hypothetical protein
MSNLDNCSLVNTDIPALILSRNEFRSSTLDQVATYQLSIKAVFERLSQNEKLYAHRLSQAAWHGSRIIMRQTSPEGTGIFDFILELHKACDGQWNQFCAGLWSLDRGAGALPGICWHVLGQIEQLLCMRVADIWTQS